MKLLKKLPQSDDFEQNDKPVVISYEGHHHLPGWLEFLSEHTELKLQEILDSNYEAYVKETWRGILSPCVTHVAHMAVTQPPTCCRNSITHKQNICHRSGDLILHGFMVPVEPPPVFRFAKDFGIQGLTTDLTAAARKALKEYWGSDSALAGSGAGGWRRRCAFLCNYCWDPDARLRRLRLQLLVVGVEMGFSTGTILCEPFVFLFCWGPGILQQPEPETDI